MAVLKPSISQIIPFDATQDYILPFILDPSTDQCFGNRIIIYNNSTNAVVYDNTVTSFLISHDIPINTLVNGTIYKITVAYFNLSGTYSSFSDGTIFKCLATPIVSLSNLAANQIVASNTFTPIGLWSEANGDSLNTYEYYLYDGNGVPLQSSPTLFYSPSNVIQYQFTNLINNTKYGIALHTMSVSGVEVDIAIIYFTVEYIAPSFSGTLLLTNLSDSGQVQIQSDVVQVIGQSTGQVSFQGSDWIDLSQGNTVTFDSAHGMNVFSNFTLGFFGKDIILDVPFITLTTLLGKIELCWRSWNGCINATKTVNGSLTSPYNIFEQKVSLTLTNEIYVQLKQINNLLDLQYEIKS
jgi:hypothetical protein